MISSTYASYPPLLNIEISVLSLLSFKLKSNYEATLTEEVLTRVDLQALSAPSLYKTRGV